MKRPKAYLEEEPTMQMVKFVTILLDNYFNFLIMCRKSRTYDKPEVSYSFFNPVSLHSS